VERVARALFQRGARREGVALLRGAVARDRGAERCRALLDEVLAGGEPAAPPGAIELDLARVDGWIREGMLVEALALLGGTPMGSLETGREWANLLGELLAPVPVDAEETLVEMHRQLLGGGASVALTLLEERARRDPPLPAWARRRLELLRWMLLDNAGTAERPAALPDEAPSPLSGAIRGAVSRRDFSRALEAARAFARARPDHRDAARTVEALASLCAELQRLPEEVASEIHTVPMADHAAALMQLEMGNLHQARAIYGRLVARTPADGRARRMLADVGALMRALSGAPVVEEEPVGAGAPPADFRDDEPTLEDEPMADDTRPERLPPPLEGPAETPDEVLVRAILPVE
jgi:CBS domain-containing protein